jgi:hypothetical protein
MTLFRGGAPGESVAAGAGASRVAGCAERDLDTLQAHST